MCAWAYIYSCTCLACNVVGKPVQTLIETLSCGCTCALDVPVVDNKTISEAVKTTTICGQSSFRLDLFFHKYGQTSRNNLIQKFSAMSTDFQLV